MLVNEILSLVEDGEKCPFQALIDIKKMSEEIENAEKRIKEIALKQFDNKTNGNEKTAKLYGYEFSKTSSGRYFYKHYETYVIKESELKTIEERMKIALKQGQNYIDENTGECYPPAEYTPSKISLSMKALK